MLRWILLISLSWVATWIMLSPKPKGYTRDAQLEQETTRPIPRALGSIMSTPKRLHQQSNINGPLELNIEIDQTLLHPIDTTRRFMRVSISAPTIAKTQRAPLNIAVLLDASGSMNKAGKLEEAQSALSQLWSSLSPNDRFTLITFADSAQVVHQNQLVGTSTNPPIGLSFIQPEGGTNLYDGLHTALEALKLGDNAQNIDRLILISDGKANVGPSSKRHLKEQASRFSEQGYSLSAIGLGVDYDETALRMLTDVGGGTYHLVDAAHRMNTVLQNEIASNTTMASSSTVVSLSFPNGVTPLRYLGWFPEKDGRSTRIHLGELYSNMKKQVFIEVEIEPEVMLSNEIVQARLSYFDHLSSERITQTKAVLASKSNDPLARVNSVNHSLINDAKDARTTWEILQWVDTLDEHDTHIPALPPNSRLNGVAKQYQKINPLSEAGKRWKKELEYTSTRALRVKP